MKEVLEIAVLVINMCVSDIDPRYNKYQCISDVFSCYGVENQDLNTCMDFWYSNKESKRLLLK